MLYKQILGAANQKTLSEVLSFIQSATETIPSTRIPSGFIITGPNIASQDFLFGQLSESLQSNTPAKFVRLRSGDASNLKAALKKIIRGVTARVSEDDDDLEVAVGKDVCGLSHLSLPKLELTVLEGRNYLNYDLEAIHAHLKTSSHDHVIIAFQDSEAFDSGLLSDLIQLFR